MARLTEVHLFIILLHTEFYEGLSQMLLALIQICLTRRHITPWKINIFAENFQSSIKYLVFPHNYTQPVNPLQKSKCIKVPVYQLGLGIDQGATHPFPFLFIYFSSAKYPTLLFPEKEFNNRLSNTVEVLQIHKANCVHL